MADIVTTLHPEGVQEDNLYPNIKRENIPDTALFGYKLWENANPNGGMSEQDITVASMAPYSRIVFVFKKWAASTVVSATETYIKSFGDLTLSYVGGTAFLSRDLSLVNDTQIHVSKGMMSGAENANALVPGAIYGIK